LRRGWNCRENESATLSPILLFQPGKFQPHRSAAQCSASICPKTIPSITCNAWNRSNHLQCILSYCDNTAKGHNRTIAVAYDSKCLLLADDPARQQGQGLQRVRIRIPEFWNRDGTKTLRRVSSP